MGKFADFYNGLAKPRSVSEWRERFEHWKKPASDTEEEKLAAVRRQILKALEKSDWLVDKGYIIIPQGSYRNNTNVRNDSDIDICVRLNHAVTWQPSGDDVISRQELGLSELSYSFQDFKGEVYSALVKTFGASAVQLGDRCIKMNENIESKCDADVVPAYIYRYYRPKTRWYLNIPSLAAEGIAFYDDADNRYYNYPEQHYLNGVKKNKATSLRYKNIVRIFKRLRNHMAKNHIAETTAAKSFLLESLVYNCHDDAFSDSDLYSCLKKCAEALQRLLSNWETAKNMVEVNEIKFLFNGNQKWTLQEALSFVEAANSYVNFSE